MCVDILKEAFRKAYSEGTYSVAEFIEQSKQDEQLVKKYETEPIAWMVTEYSGPPIFTTAKPSDEECRKHMLKCHPLYMAGCHRSHPHEDMDATCQRFAEYERRLADMGTQLREANRHVALLSKEAADPLMCAPFHPSEAMYEAGMTYLNSLPCNTAWCCKDLYRIMAKTGIDERKASA